jgi:hypothetical protein
MQQIEQGRRVRFYEIDWDTDGEEVSSLPKSVELVVDEGVDISLEGADVLSDKFGWCVNSFQIEHLYAAPNPEWRDVADHVLQMQEEYGFNSGGDSLREAIDESAKLLHINLAEEDSIKACHFVEEQNQ